MSRILPSFLQPYFDLSRVVFSNKKANYICLFVGIISFVSTALLLIYSQFYISDASLRDKFVSNKVVPAALPLGMIVTLYIFYILSQTEDLFSIRLSELELERKEITRQIETKKELDIFHTIQLSLNQLNEYYTINKGQAVSSFRFSVFSIIIGLITIISGIWFVFLGSTNVTIGFMTATSGIILEFIGGAYFFMYKKSISQVNFFFAQLIKVQDTMLAIKLGDSITNEDKKTAVHEKIIMSLLERSLK